MRWYIPLLGAVLFLSLLGCVSQPKGVILDSFEGKLAPQTVDFGASEGSSVKVEAAKKIKKCGRQALKITYDLKPSGYMWVARGHNLDVKGATWPIEPESIAWKNYSAITLFMYGSNSGGVVAFDIKDSKKELWRFLLDDNFQGWKEITCPFAQFFPRGDWQPKEAERNEVLDFPLMSFQFEPRLPGTGVFYFDCVRVVKAEAK